ncbi:zinc finger protein [Saccharopolyspora sp. CA-218241]|uniref:zinc finger protein n=1 Tax=Saccharopolyspora sp. CA-218241 TaxID=3240027 RepID=UPI003D96E22A
MTFRPHPFSWAPGAAERHATREGEWRGAASVAALCGAEIRPVDTVESWLWPTCVRCDVEAHRIAGVPMPRRRRTAAAG